ncbi:MAG: enoyl-CoA hydratase/isomerase family protein [Acidimicrobiia bacterium]
MAVTEKPHAFVTESGDGIITVTLDRDEKLNAISPEITAVLWDATDALMDRDDLRVMVVSAVGRYFTAGIDLKHGPGNRPADPTTAHLHPGWSYRRNYRSHHLLYDEWEDIEKPIVIAVPATILGAGVEMAMSCDFRFSTPNAEWGVPEVTLGVLAGSGGTSRLTRLVGPHWARWMAMAGERVTAEEALRIGLIHRILPIETFMDDVYAFCRKLIDIPAETLGLAKMVIDIAADTGDRNVQRHVDRLANTHLDGGEENQRRTARFKK